jgi:hypothetical protein
VTTPQDISASSGFVPMSRLFFWALKGNESAVALCMTVFSWANMYDHLVDEGDLPASEFERVLHDAMWALAVDLPSNSFYREHMGELVVTIANSITAWRTSCILQRDGDEHGARLAYVLRWVPIEFFLHCARIVGGEEWAHEIAPQFWRVMTRDHSFTDFVSECGG